MGGLDGVFQDEIWPSYSLCQLLLPLKGKSDLPVDSRCAEAMRARLVGYPSRRRCEAVHAYVQCFRKSSNTGSYSWASPFWTVSVEAFSVYFVVDINWSTGRVIRLGAKAPAKESLVEDMLGYDWIGSETERRG